MVGVGEDRWDVLVGGAAGASVRRGDVLATVDGHDKVVRLAGVFMQYYRENAKWLERTYDFVPRVGLEKIRAIVVDDSEAIAARLDAALQASVGAYADPWKEASAPKTPNQFRSVLPVTGSVAGEAIK